MYVMCVCVRECVAINAHTFVVFMAGGRRSLWPTFHCECETPRHFPLLFLGHVHVLYLS